MFGGLLENEAKFQIDGFIIIGGYTHNHLLQ